MRIDCQTISESTLDSILLNFPDLKELNINFPYNWTGYFDIIAHRCRALEKLTLYSCFILHNQEEYNSLKFLSNTNSFKNTLTSLTLNNLNFCCSANSLYLRNYYNLKLVKLQILNRGYGRWGSVVPFNEDFWPCYSRTCYLNRDFDGYKLAKMY
jgi:hypothetical protein